jgi:hypothetical protein
MSFHHSSKRPQLSREKLRKEIVGQILASRQSDQQNLIINIYELKSNSTKGHFLLTRRNYKNHLEEKDFKGKKS